MDCIFCHGRTSLHVQRTVQSFNDAFFESSSGFTTTGSSIINDVEILPFSILFWRSLTHWIGGLGIIVLVIIILPSLKITGQQLLSLESSLKEKIHPKTKAIGYRLLFVYLGLTVIEIILLNLGDMTLFDSICHSFGTIATGGFSTRNSNIAYLFFLQPIHHCNFHVFAGISFIIYYYLVKLQFGKIRKNEELWFYVSIVLFSGLIATGIFFFKTTGLLNPPSGRDFSRSYPS